MGKRGALSSGERYGAGPWPGLSCALPPPAWSPLRYPQKRKKKGRNPSPLGAAGAGALRAPGGLPRAGGEAAGSRGARAGRAGTGTPRRAPRGAAAPRRPSSAAPLAPWPTGSSGFPARVRPSASPKRKGARLASAPAPGRGEKKPKRSGGAPGEHPAPATRLPGPAPPRPGARPQLSAGAPRALGAPRELPGPGLVAASVKSTSFSKGKKKKKSYPRAQIFDFFIFFFPL